MGSLAHPVTPHSIGSTSGAKCPETRCETQRARLSGGPRERDVQRFSDHDILNSLRNPIYLLSNARSHGQPPLLV